MLTTTSDVPSAPAPLSPQPVPVIPTPVVPNGSSLKNKRLMIGVLAGLVIFILISAAAFGVYQLGKNQTPNSSTTVAAPSTEVKTSEASPAVTPASDLTANWKTYKNNELQYEFKYPPNPLEPQKIEGDTAFVIGYFINEGNPNNFQDVQNPDKTYWTSLGYISQAQLGLMGITYCGAYPNDSSRCETITIGGVSSSIDWNLPVEYTKVGINGKEEKATQIKATVWIPHSKGGVVTVELQPVVPKSKETLYQILSTFKFLNQSPSSPPDAMSDEPPNIVTYKGVPISP